MSVSYRIFWDFSTGWELQGFWDAVQPWYEGGMGFMRRFVETMRRSWVFSSIITVALGVVLLLYPDTTSTVLCYGVGAVLLFHGMLDLVRYFTRQEGEFFLRYELAAGIILCAVGTFMLIQPEIVTMVIPMILGIYIVIDGGVNVRRSFEMKELEFSRWWAAMVVAALMILLGLVMFLNPFAAAQVTVMFIGVVLIYQGVSDFIILMLIGVWKRRLENRIEEQGGR